MAESLPVLTARPCRGAAQLCMGLNVQSAKRAGEGSAEVRMRNP